MGFKCGIVGLPNVGKSTIFNAVTNAGAEAANFPFCTKDPNVGMVPVPDKRLKKLSEVYKPLKLIPTLMQFVDIAGLVRGANKGEGLGNQFLTHIRETEAIMHVVRCFEDTDVTHVEETVDPVRDAELILLELMLKDMDSLESKIQREKKLANSGQKDSKIKLPVLEKVMTGLGNNLPVFKLGLSEEENSLIQDLRLLTAKPMFFCANVLESEIHTENNHVKNLRQFASNLGCDVVVISGKIEAEIAELADEEKEGFLKELGIEESGLDRIIHMGYEKLGLQTYLTAGEKECRAWTIPKGCKAPQAAGVIHSDFEKGFIRAETVAWNDFIKCGSWNAAREAGLLRTEGKEYVVQDGDIMNFLFNV